MVILAYAIVIFKIVKLIATRTQSYANKMHISYTQTQAHTQINLITKKYFNLFHISSWKELIMRLKKNTITTELIYDK